ncbi:MAG: serine hydrolase domain-containing protein, partial [Bacteroidota bacterium]
HHKAVGYKDLAAREVLQTNHIFRIASQTKAIVSVGLMMLYEEGHFLLEDPIEKYLPAFANMRVLSEYDPETLEYTTQPAEQSITIRHLLTHTAGIPYGHPLEGRPEFQVPYFASMDNESTEEVVNRIARRPLLHEPGEKFTYGLNTDVIGRLVEVLSGEPLDEYVRRRVLQPLGMEDSYFYLPRAKRERLVTLYSKLTADTILTLHKNATYRNFAIDGAQTYFSAGAGSVGTITDYAKFCQMLLNRGKFNGTRLLAPKTVDLMTRNHIDELEVWNRKDKFGLGFMIITPVSHYGDQATPGSYKWGGMYCSEYTIDPEEELIMLIYTNVHPIPQYSEVVRKFRILTYAALEEEGLKD